MKVYTYMEKEGSGMVMFTTEPKNRDAELKKLVKNPAAWEFDSEEDEQEFYKDMPEEEESEPEKEEE